MKMLEMVLAGMTYALLAVVVKIDAGDFRVVVKSGTPSANEEAMPSLDGASTWLNSVPLTATALRGRVVLVDFWRSGQRELPYFRKCRCRSTAYRFRHFSYHH